MVKPVIYYYVKSYVPGKINMEELIMKKMFALIALIVLVPFGIIGAHRINSNNKKR
jgi:hypothetical protein